MTEDPMWRTVLGPKVELNALALAELIGLAEAVRTDEGQDEALQTGWSALANQAPEICEHLYTLLNATLNPDKFAAMADRIERLGNLNAPDAEIGTAIAQAALRLRERDPDANTIDEVAAAHGMELDALLAEETHIDIEDIRAYLGRYLGRGKS